MSILIGDFFHLVVMLATGVLFWIIKVISFFFNPVLVHSVSWKTCLGDLQASG